MKRLLFVSAIVFACASFHQDALAQPQPGAGQGKMFNRVDANGDGKISKQEMLAKAEARFDKRDLNNDGFIDQGEANTMRQQIRERVQKLRQRGLGQQGTGAAQ